MQFPFLASYVTPRFQALLLGLVVVSLILNGILWYGALELFPADDPAAVLHYSIDVGIDFIGESRQITTLPLIGLSLIIFNFIVGLALARADVRTSWVLWSICPVAQIILLVAFYLLWKVNV
ncbi:MAG: hypothetical protein WD972_02250 [Candidatus Andersenbacteria bacterium]